jgi:site-specific DNA recombinase
LTAAPYGYRYIRRDLGGGVARFEVVEEEAQIVRRIFRWVAQDRLSLSEVRRRLQQMTCQSPRGLSRWNITTLRAVLANAAYIGRAVLGRSRVLPARPRLRLVRRNARPSPGVTQRVRGPREEWIEIAVPPLVEPETFEAAGTQLAENRKRKRAHLRGPRWLLQGLVVCRRCRYAYYAKASRLSPTDPSKGSRHYYRCIGADAHRFNGAAKCTNPMVRGDKLEQVVWDEVMALLNEPSRIADEYRRRISQARDAAMPSAEIAQIERQMTALRRGIDRLIDSYASGLIDRAEFEPRITGLKQRMTSLSKQCQLAAEAADTERELSLVVSRLEEFSAKVSHGLDQLNGLGRRELVHTLVRKIEIDEDDVAIVFRVPPPAGAPPAGSELPSAGFMQHCTDVYARLQLAMGRPQAPLPAAILRDDHAQQAARDLLRMRSVLVARSDRFHGIDTLVRTESAV